MQQGHRFVCSVATGVETGTPITCGENRGGSGRHREVRPARGGTPLPPGLAIRRGAPSKIFLTFSLERFRSRVQYPLQALLRGL
jgi:hypothetical protein